MSFWPDKLSDWAGIYGAALSTIIALGALWKSWRSGPRLAVNIERPKSPNESKFSDGRRLKIKIENVGTTKTTIYAIHISDLTTKNNHKIAKFDRNSNFNPAITLEPNQIEFQYFDFFTGYSFNDFISIGISILHTGSKRPFKTIISDTGLIGGK